MNGDFLDILLVLLALVFGVAGYRQGLIVGLLSFSGFVGGGVVGAIYGPKLANRLVGERGLGQVGGLLGEEDFATALLALVFVFLAAVLGQFLASSLGVAAQNLVTWRPARVLDALGGAVASVLALLLVAWLLGTALATSQFPSVAYQVRHSQVLSSVERVIPDVAHTWFSSLWRVVDQQAFPRVFGDLREGPVTEVPPPDEDVLGTEALQEARRSVVKIVGTAPGCDRRSEGSGFVYGPEHVLTNAHVVAGVRGGAEVITLGGESYEGEVVLFDPGSDVAVLHVPDLPLSDLDFAGRADRGASAVVAGYPEGGDFDTVPARIRDYQRVTGLGIYQAQQVTREVYTLRARVEPGNSGGPLLSPSGDVYGMVFAASVEDANTGYALTSGEVLPDATRAADETEPVSTMSCR